MVCPASQRPPETLGLGRLGAALLPVRCLLLIGASQQSFLTTLFKVLSSTLPYILQSIFYLLTFVIYSAIVLLSH